jgi:hypothetical protein
VVLETAILPELLLIKARYGSKLEDKIVVIAPMAFLVVKTVPLKISLVFMVIIPLSLIDKTVS